MTQRQMQSINEGKRFMSMKEIVPMTSAHMTPRSMLNSKMGAWAGASVFVLLFVASLAYVAFGGPLAFEASPIPEAEASVAFAKKLADVGGAMHKESAAATRWEDGQ